MTDEERTEREAVRVSDVEAHVLRAQDEEPTEDTLTESADDDVDAHMSKPRAGT